MTTETAAPPAVTPAQRAAVAAHRAAHRAFTDHLETCSACEAGRFCHAMWRLDRDCDAAAYRLGLESRR